MFLGQLSSAITLFSVKVHHSQIRICHNGVESLACLLRFFPYRDVITCFHSLRLYWRRTVYHFCSHPSALHTKRFFIQFSEILRAVILLPIFLIRTIRANVSLTNRSFWTTVRGLLPTLRLPFLRRLRSGMSSSTIWILLYHIWLVKLGALFGVESHQMLLSAARVDCFGSPVVIAIDLHSSKFYVQLTNEVFKKIVALIH